MASRLFFYFSLLFLLLTTTAIVASDARNTPAITPIASKERHGEMIGLEDYGDTRANHRHDPHHPLSVKGSNKELDG